MKNQDFLESVDQELARRLALFDHYSSIVPRTHESKKALSWFIDLHNRPQLQPFQKTQELTTDEAGVDNYTAWAEQHRGENSRQPYEADPDQLTDAHMMWPNEARYSEGQYTAASQILRDLHNVLTTSELEVWNLKETGLGVTEIADVRGVSTAAISQTLARCERKVRKAYAEIRTQPDSDADSF